MNDKSVFLGTLGNAFAGAGLGLAVGMIAGLSASPVVSIILGSISALLAAFLGLSDAGKLDPGLTPEQLRMQDARRSKNGIRAGSFGCACVAGILLGLFIRATDYFVPYIDDQVALWQRAGYTADQARQFVVFERLGVSPDWSDITDGAMQRRKTSALFSGSGEAGICEEISPARFGNDPREVLYAYRQQDREKLAVVAETIDRLTLTRPALRELVNAVSEAVCETESMLD